MLVYKLINLEIQDTKKEKLEHSHTCPLDFNSTNFNYLYTTKTFGSV